MSQSEQDRWPPGMQSPLCMRDLQKVVVYSIFIDALAPESIAALRRIAGQRSVSSKEEFWQEVPKETGAGDAGLVRMWAFWT